LPPMHTDKGYDGFGRLVTHLRQGELSPRANLFV